MSLGNFEFVTFGPVLCSKADALNHTLSFKPAYRHIGPQHIGNLITGRRPAARFEFF
jgi:hypothetical protein